MIIKGIKFGFFVITILLLNVHVVFGQSKYIWPLADHDKYGKYLTSVFAEYRADRFHAGIDIKTILGKGHEVVAVADGFLYRVLVSPFGYGKAVYLKLNDGKIVVYGHLRGFSPKIQKLVEEEQLSRQSYSIDIWYNKNEVPVKQGEIVGVTGRTGTKLQHLHFEIRDKNNQPMNPIQLGFEAVDNSPPRPTKLSIRPMNIDSNVNGDWKPQIIYLNKAVGNVFIIDDPIDIWGEIGLSIDIYDRNEKYLNNYGISSLKLIVDEKEIFASFYNSYNYDNNKEINLDRDYRLLRRDIGKFQKLFVDFGNTLPFYGDYKTNDGIITTSVFEKNRIPFEINITDFFNNTSIVKGNFNIKSYQQQVIFESTKTGIQEKDNINTSGFVYSEDYQDDYLRIRFNSNTDLVQLPEVYSIDENSTKRNYIVHAEDFRNFVTAAPLDEIDDGSTFINMEGFSSKERFSNRIPVHLYRIPPEGNNVVISDNAGTVSFRKNDVYEDIWLRIAKEKPQNGRDIDGIVSDIFYLEPKEVFLRSDILLTLNYPSETINPYKLGIYAQDDKGKWHFIGNDLNLRDNSVRTEISSLEKVAVIKDTEIPVIMRYSPADNAVLTTDSPEITVWFDDDLAGIENEEDIELYIDGIKMIAEWDPIMKLIRYKPKNGFETGIHRIRFRVSDRVDNVAEKEWMFTVR
ncbi:M23 family metallopeptidase [candidate division KSB1 bacterium]